MFVFNINNKIYLDFLDIHTTHLSAKLVHQYLELYTLIKQISLTSYKLRPSLLMKKLHLVFNIVKLTTVFIDSISS